MIKPLLATAASCFPFILFFSLTAQAQQLDSASGLRLLLRENMDTAILDKPQATV